ncbi:PiggyBac transposable element-derived protein 5 [Willisornis vidua]|uniref:PiggyBac transposable element-derived protein 5 n=2 Tax=Neoaves TaxID=3078114 RepID=A0ABQ9D3E2_9PASS|nr:PiggyBac transposable element-derived protein 5 [Willisornis vidua]
MEEEEEEEEAEKGGWTRSLRDVPPPPFKDGSDILPNVQPKPRLAQLEARPSCPIAGCLQENADPHMATTAFHRVIAEPPFFRLAHLDEAHLEVHVHTFLQRAVKSEEGWYPKEAGLKKSLNIIPMQILSSVPWQITGFELFQQGSSKSAPVITLSPVGAAVDFYFKFLARIKLHEGSGICEECALEKTRSLGQKDVTVDCICKSFQCGPTRKMPLTASAMDFFQLFVPDNVLKNMVVQTNMYAKKYQERFGSDDAWIDVTLTEMKAFLGYMISTSIHHCESVLSIWSSGFYSNKSIALIMTQSRFEKILKYFHIVAFRSSQTTHGLYKIQPFLDSLQNGFDSAFRPSQAQVLHEPLIDEDPVFIATCTERELRKRKKRKFSLWVRQCSSTGFICQVGFTSSNVLIQFQEALKCVAGPKIYVHLKEGSGADGLDALKNKPQLHSMVAKSLCQNASGKNYIIFTGPSITSLNLFEEFEKQEIYCCGLLSTRKSDCTGLPPSMLNNSETPQFRGQYRIRMKGNMSLICWYNKGHFRFLTNAYSPVQQGVIIKRKSGEIPCPLAVEAFAAHLSYICKYDDKYSKYFISHKPNKTWQQVFWFAISIAINNAYILYKMSEAYHVTRFCRGTCCPSFTQEVRDAAKQVLGLMEVGDPQAWIGITSPEQRGSPSAAQPLPYPGQEAAGTSCDMETLKCNKPKYAPFLSSMTQE